MEILCIYLYTRDGVGRTEQPELLGYGMVSEVRDGVRAAIIHTGVRHVSGMMVYSVDSFRKIR